MAKRLFDLVFASVALVTLSSLFCVIACWIKLGSKGSVFFRQQRVGRYGQMFCIYKFRTMRVDAEQTGLQVTTAQDSRITRQGRILRKYKLDELPQFINVWMGDMSVVGPRPEVKKYMDVYPEDVRHQVLSVRPGITDLASIEFKDENSLLDEANDPEQTYITKILPIKQAYYLAYVRDHTLWSDMKIIFKTVREILH